MTQIHQHRVVHQRVAQVTASLSEGEGTHSLEHFSTSHSSATTIGSGLQADAESPSRRQGNYRQSGRDKDMLGQGSSSGGLHGLR